MTARPQRRILGIVVAGACLAGWAAGVVDAHTVGARRLPAPGGPRASHLTSTQRTVTATAAMAAIFTSGSAYTSSDLPGAPGAVPAPPGTTVPFPATTTTTTTTTVTSASTSTTTGRPNPAPAPGDLQRLIAAESHLKLDGYAQR